MPGAAQAIVKVLPRMADVPAAAWDRVANPDRQTVRPVCRACLSPGARGRRHGVAAHRLGAAASGARAGGRRDRRDALYLKSHSRGEYVFDYGWAEAYERAGGDYYPKLQAAIPFTPVPGRRLLVRCGDGAETREQLLTAGAIELANRHGASLAPHHVPHRRRVDAARRARAAAAHGPAVPLAEPGLRAPSTISLPASPRASARPSARSASRRWPPGSPWNW